MRAEPDQLMNRPSAAQGRPETCAPKRKKLDSDACSQSLGLSYINPSSLVKAREGMFKPPTHMGKYLNKLFRHCLHKEEHEAIFKQHSRADFTQVHLSSKSM